MSYITATFTVFVSYDNDYTDPDSLVSALDRLMETALSTPGIMEEYGPVDVGEFLPSAPHPST